MATVFVVAGVLTAVGLSVKAFILKRLSATHTSLELGFISAVLATVMLLPVGAYSATQLSVSPQFLTLVGVVFVGLVNTGGMYAFFRALRVEDLSVVSPLRQTVPVFVAVMEPVVLLSAFSLNVFLGAVLATIGGYITLAETRNPLTPLKRVTSQGPLFAVLSAVLLALGAVGVKFVVGRMPIGLFVFLMFGVMAAGFTLLLSLQKRPDVRSLLERQYLVLGGVTAVTQVLIFYTIQLGTAATATILFRLSVLFNIFIGYTLLGERHILYRLAGSILIMGGILLVI